VEAAGGIEVVALSYREGHHTTASSSSSSGTTAAAAAATILPASATASTPPRVNRTGVDAALGIGPGSGNPMIDGDGLPGLSSPEVERPPFPDATQRPVAHDANVLRR
jgi:hypothetical protein